MIKPGDRLYKLFNRTHAYELRMPAPPTLANIENHLEQLGATGANDLIDGLDVVELEVVSVRPARDTERCPAPMDDEEADRVFRQQQDTLTGEDAAE